MKDKNFFVAHYDVVVAAVGALALVAGVAFFFVSGGEDRDVAADEAAQEVRRMKPAKTGVASVDMTALDAAVRLVKSPATVASVSGKDASFLASERRVTCKKCKKVISGDIRKQPECPFCHEKQETPKKVVLDADGDGLPDEWEKRFGLNPNDSSDAQKDLDGDGFTNLEEFKANTDPKDPTDHPDYLDSLAIQLPLEKTSMPFIFTKATQIPKSWRCEFFFPGLKDDYGRTGRTITAVVGEEIGDAKNRSGYVFKKFEKKEVKRERKGMKGMQVSVDVSEVTVERKSDGKRVTLVLAESKKAKPQSVDVKATLAYTRGSVKNFDVVTGDEITLNRDKFKVVEILPTANGVKITFKNVRTGAKKTLSALAQ